MLFDDIYAFNAYLGRTENFCFIEKVPFWEYSVCLGWCDSLHGIEQESVIRKLFFFTAGSSISE